MPRHTPIQNSFNAGEFSPRMFGRTDLEKYRSAARTIQNFLIIPQGGLVRRSGTRYVANAASDATKSRLQAFVFSDVQAYVLEWSDKKLRMFVDEGLLLQQTLTPIDSNEDVASITDEITFVGHGYNDDDGPVRISSTLTVPPGLTAVTDYYIRTAVPILIPAADTDPDNEEFTVAAHDLAEQMGPYHFEITDLDASGTLPTGLDYDRDYYLRSVATDTFKLSESPGGSIIEFSTNGSGTHVLIPTPEYKRNKFRLAVGIGLPTVDITGPGTGNHTITPRFPQAIELVTPYSSSELDSLQFAQSADVLYIAHRDHAPRTLSRFSLSGFSLDIIDFDDGPYLDENVNSAIKLTPAQVTGKNITLTSTVAIFKGTDVGRPVRILSDNTVDDPAWGWARIVAVNPNAFTNDDVVQAAVTGADTGTDVITVPSHGMNTGDLVSFEDVGGTLPGNVFEGVSYFVRELTTSTVTLHGSASDALNDIDIHNITAGFLAPIQMTSSVLNIIAHGFIGGEGPLTLTNEGGGLPTGFAEGTEYFVGFIDVDHMTLSASRGGTPVRIDSAPTGTGGVHTMQGSSAPLATCQIDIKRDFQSNSQLSEAWRLGAWSGDATLGFPRAVTFHEQRLWWAGSKFEPQKVWSSRSSRFLDYAPTGIEGEDLGNGNFGFTSLVFDSNGVTHEIGASQVNVIQWISGGRTLLLGASNASWAASSSLVSGAITPADFQVRQAGGRGSAPIVPAIVDDRVVYVSSTNQKAFALGYSFESDNYLAEDLTLFAEHIGVGNLVALDYSHEPHSSIWFVRGDGVVVTLTLIRSEKIAGWSRHIIGGTDVEVESVAVIPSPVGDASAVGRVNRNHDQVWFVVKRTVNGATERWVEFIEDVYEDTDVLEDAFFLDGGSTYNSASTLTPGPFNHLKGETVDVLADGRQHLGLVVDATTGLITLPEAAALVHVGYRMTSSVRSLRLELPAPDGTVQSNLKRIDHIVLRLNDSLGGKYGPDASSLTELGRELIPFDIDMDTVATPFSGDIEVDFDAGWESYGEIFLQQDEPLPFSVLAVLARLQWSARGDRARGGA